MILNKYISALIRGFLFILIVVAPVWSTSAIASSGTYEAPLPAQLSTDPNLCAYVPCQDVMPGADSFSNRKGKPPYVEAYQGDSGDKKLIGYVFLSTDIVDIPAYSGKPVVTLIGMDKQGIITGAKVLRHSEPILLLGIPEAELTKFIKQYLGKFVGSKIEIGKSREGQGYIGLDAISGATVTVIAQNQVMLRSGMEIAKQVGIIKPTIRPQAKFTAISNKLSWEEMVKQGVVQHLTVSTKDVGVEGEGPYIDMYFGYLNTPAVGKNVLGEFGYNRLMSDLKPGEHAIFIIANGMESFKGSGFVRGGIYDRIQVSQEMDTFTFRDLDYLNLYGIEAAGAPAYHEAGIFIIRSKSFSGAYPWSLVFLANKADKETGTKTFTNFDKEYWLPARYLEGGRPAVERPEPVWVRVWKDKKIEIGLFVLLLLGTAIVYGLRDKLVRRAKRKDKRWVSIPKYFIWITSVGFVGFYLMAQPSITQILTWFHSILYQWRWELFLSDPFIFIFWWFIIITVFFWGRGLFCGWLCPYGSLSELAFKFGERIGLKRFQFMLPHAVHDKLKWLKYGIFAGLLAVSFYSMGMAEKMAEVEPFKTTFLVGVWNRSWPFVLFWGALFGISIFTERPFCKYLCPLGAGLAIPSTFRFFGLKRKKECNTCTACAVGCGSLAIDKQGKIDQRECLLCLDCMVMYYDSHACPPLSKERKLREKAGQPLTKISPQGYFIPIKEIQQKK
ncbi:4Fe-4S binding protein [Sulfurirhabdus autotrophica]|uniref:NosR/NirI family nitrous oxide reductase transcriptional regulator n=1 Tax=Sulfurirhabdus autotrophica TaxID=1706046 RepID=A0A4R3XWD8_9PROT|nr:4Fe-4S binding protein [Sulfurirhabdus autotrophica]TCV83267.1 NosR/NirI family nitrous oxide reductase transcriptional regulator [Sulfurirhabdus autotrophica]